MATALFVIDIQNDLATDPKTRIPHAERINVAGKAILAAARMQQGAPQIIIFVQHEEQPEDGPLVRGSDPWKLVFEPREDAPRERRIAKWTRTRRSLVSLPDTGMPCTPLAVMANADLFTRRHFRVQPDPRLRTEGSRCRGYHRVWHPKRVLRRVHLHWCSCCRVQGHPAFRGTLNI